MKVLSKIELEFSNAVLPVWQNEEGHEVVPVKPIIEAIRVDWMTQYRRMQTPYMTRRLGVCVGPVPYAGQVREMVCIRVDRVAALLNQIDPAAVRGAGNEAAADFLEAKQAEWDDLIHEYETRKGGMLESVSRDKSLSLRMYLAVLRVKSAIDSPADRKALTGHAKALSAAAGVPYQPDWVDGGEE